MQNGAAHRLGQVGTEALVGGVLAELPGQTRRGGGAQTVNDHCLTQLGLGRQGGGPQRFFHRQRQRPEHAADVVDADAPGPQRRAVALFAEVAARPQLARRRGHRVVKRQMLEGVQGVVVDEHLQRGLGRQVVRGMLQRLAQRRHFPLAAAGNRDFRLRSQPPSNRGHRLLRQGL